MNYDIAIINDEDYPIDAERLKASAQMVLRQQKTPSAALTIVMMSDENARQLNREFRGVDAPTDVLSFPSGASPAPISSEPPYLGDIIIAYPYTAAQAQSLGHPVGDSLALLAIHGTLHLLGYDHDTPENRARMWSAQADALGALGISDSIVPTLESYDDDHEKGHG